MRESNIHPGNGRHSVKSRSIGVRVALFASLALALLTVFAANAGRGSSDRKNVQKQDYALWNTMSMVASQQPDAKKSISSDGKWVAYQLGYESHPERNELYVRSLVDDRVYKISGEGLGEFTSNGRWYIHSGREGGIGVLDLQTGVQNRLAGSGRYEVVRGTSIVISLAADGEKGKAAGKRLVVANLEDGTAKEIENVQAYKLDQNSGRVAYVAGIAEVERIDVLDVESMSGMEILTGDQGVKFGSLSWSKSGDALGFISKAVDGTKSVGLYNPNRARSEIRWLLPEGAVAMPTEYVPVDESLFVSDGAKWVLVSGSSKAGLEGGRDKRGVRIWNARSRDLPSLYPSHEASNKVFAWWPDRDQVVPVTKPGQSLALLSADKSTALALTKTKILLPDGYELDHKLLAPVDVYLVDMKTGRQRLLLERQGSLSMSPSGRHIAYLRNGDWWVYSIDNNSHTKTKVKSCAECSLVQPWAEGGAFSAKVHNRGYGTPGWLEDGAGFLFYDEFDIWQTRLDNGESFRITHGREKGVRYRVPSAGSSPFTYYRSGRNFGIETGKNLILSSYGMSTKESGFATWDKQLGVTDIILDDVHVSFAAPVPGGNGFLYMRERFDMPRELVAIDPSSGKQRVLGRSNVHHSQFLWGKAELIDYQTQDGDTLQGILYYPAGYQSGKKYPMVVDIYEHQSDTLHHYINPTNAYFDRTTNLTLEGYFVFKPDISYRLDEPGQSAVSCVVAGVEKVLSRGVINPDAVGLMGHSLGGYETTFIITRTNLFAAAIAGAAVTDTVSMYFSMRLFEPEPYVFQFENQQFRMGAPFFRDKVGYLKNSPIHNADKIHTPLLAWAGTKDDAVPVEQSFEMFVALRRMGKEHIFLEYPGANHMLTGGDAEDLYARFMDWFDYHLKKKPPARWITQGEQVAESQQ